MPPFYQIEGMFLYPTEAFSRANVGKDVQLTYVHVRNARKIRYREYSKIDSPKIVKNQRPK